MKSKCSRSFWAIQPIIPSILCLSWPAEQSSTIPFNSLLTHLSWHSAAVSRMLGPRVSGPTLPFFSSLWIQTLLCWNFFAIAMAVFLWAPKLQGKYIVLHSDSLATVEWLTCKRAPIPAALQIIRQLTLTCLHFQIVVKAVHLAGTKNRELQRVAHPGRKHPRKHHKWKK